MVLHAGASQVSVIDSGSTNRPGITVRLDKTGDATVEQRNSAPQSMKLDAHLCERLMRDVAAAGVLSALPEKHCMKSVSFGSRLYVEFKGDRSPDLSCPFQSDPRARALQQDANEILRAVRTKFGPNRVRVSP